MNETIYSNVYICLGAGNYDDWKLIVLKKNEIVIISDKNLMVIGDGISTVENLLTKPTNIYLSQDATEKFIRHNLEVLEFKGTKENIPTENVDYNDGDIIFVSELDEYNESEGHFTEFIFYNGNWEKLGSFENLPQANWNEENEDSNSYILNKPKIFTSENNDINIIHDKDNQLIYNGNEIILQKEITEQNMNNETGVITENTKIISYKIADENNLVTINNMPLFKSNSHNNISTSYGVIDSDFSTTSSNPLENKIITNKLSILESEINKRPGIGIKPTQISESDELDYTFSKEFMDDHKLYYEFDNSSVDISEYEINIKQNEDTSILISGTSLPITSTFNLFDLVYQETNDFIEATFKLKGLEGAYADFTGIYTIPVPIPHDLVFVTDEGVIFTYSFLGFLKE